MPPSRCLQLLAFSLGRGPLVPQWLTPMQFCGVYMLPIVPIQVCRVAGYRNRSCDPRPHAFGPPPR